MDTKKNEFMTAKEEELYEQVQCLTDKLVKANSTMQVSIDTAVKIKEKDLNEKIRDLEIQLQKSNIDRDNAVSAKKDSDKILKKIKDTAKTEFQKRIAEETSKFNFTSQILELCNTIDSSVGAELSQLNSICIGLTGNIDYISQQRILGSIQNIKLLIDSIVNNCNIGNLLVEESINNESTSDIFLKEPYESSAVQDDSGITLEFANE